MKRFGEQGCTQAVLCVGLHVKKGKTFPGSTVVPFDTLKLQDFHF